MFSFFQRILHLSATFHTTILLNKCFLSAIPKSPSSFIEAILYSKFVHSNDLVSARCSFLPRHWSLASIWSAENNVSGVSHNILEHGGVLKNFLSAPLSILMQSSPGRDFDISSELRRKFIPLKHLTFIFVFPCFSSSGEGSKVRTYLRIQHLCFYAIRQEVVQIGKNLR